MVLKLLHVKRYWPALPYEKWNADVTKVNEVANLPNEKLAKLVKRIRKGERVAAVAREERVDEYKLRRMCHKAGITLRRGRPKGPKLAAPRRYKGIDWSMRDVEIANLLRCSRQAVNQVRKKLLKLKLIRPRLEWGVKWKNTVRIPEQ